MPETTRVNVESSDEPYFTSDFILMNQYVSMFKDWVQQWALSLLDSGSKHKVLLLPPNKIIVAFSWYCLWPTVAHAEIQIMVI
ncbi:uncharacterized protein RSE6_07910 [Rhynchosporium secalis]|nr:uncharacterized protein RSE6_07910 [Rhynchosporium secalis]